jgi:hypothetical protein
MKTSEKAQGEETVLIDPVHHLEDQVLALRDGGMTFKAAGEALSITASRARHLYLRAKRRKNGRKPVWTDGLNERLASLLRWLEFSNRDEVAQAYRSGHIQRLALRERGISAANLLELEQWLDAGGSLHQPPESQDAQVGDASDARKPR